MTSHRPVTHNVHIPGGGHQTTKVSRSHDRRVNMALTAKLKATAFPNKHISVITAQLTTTRRISDLQDCCYSLCRTWLWNSFKPVELALRNTSPCLKSWILKSSTYLNYYVLYRSLGSGIIYLYSLRVRKKRKRKYDSERKKRNRRMKKIVWWDS